MKTYNILYRSLHLAGLLLVIASCGKDEAVSPAGAESGQSLAVSIIDSGYASAEGPATRAVEDGYITKFSEGDTCGLYLLRGGQTVYSNLKLTAETDAATGKLVWKPETGKSLAGGLPDENYYIYYPYQSDMAGKTAASTGATLTDAEFFAPLIGSWQPRKDQSSYEAYAASDLMTANGSVETGTDNSLTLTFSMAHRMALAVVELPAFVYRFTNKPSIPDYVISGPTEFDSKALPYLISDGICRYLFHPSAGVEFSAYNDRLQCEFSIEIQPNQISGGSYRIYKIDGGRVVKLHTLRVGDFFLADGHLLPYDADKEKVQASNVVGIVFQTNPARVGDAEKKVLGGEAHALVMALKNAAVDVTFWITIPTEAYLPACRSKAEGYNDISGYWNSEQVRKACGDFSNYPALKAVDEYNKYYPVLATTTGWYLPSSGQCWDLLQYLGGCPALADPAEQTSDALGYNQRKDQGDVPAALNKWMAKIADKDKHTFASSDNIWTSTWCESTIHNWYISSAGYIYCRYLFTAVDYGRMIVRPVLAF